VSYVDLTSDTPYFDLDIPYLIGIDVATGSGGDNTAFIIVHPYTLEIVGELKSPYMSTNDCTRVITELASLLPRSIFCLESNHVGKAIISFVEESPLLSRFYSDPNLDISKNATTIEYSKLSLEQRSKNRQYVGTSVTATVRNTMMTLLKRYVRDYRHLMLSRFLVEDISNLIISKTGKIEADSGMHDDIVMAYLHTIYVLTYGSELGRFGIDKSLCVYEEAFKILDEYENKKSDHISDNTLPYDVPTIYEEKLLRDLTSMNEEFINEGGIDEYGYSRNQYAGVNVRDNEERMTLSDLAFFRDVNNFY